MIGGFADQWSQPELGGGLESETRQKDQSGSEEDIANFQSAAPKKKAGAKAGKQGPEA